MIKGTTPELMALLAELCAALEKTTDVPWDLLVALKKHSECSPTKLRLRLEAILELVGPSMRPINDPAAERRHEEDLKRWNAEARDQIASTLESMNEP